MTRLSLCAHIEYLKLAVSTRILCNAYFMNVCGQAFFNSFAWYSSSMRVIVGLFLLLAPSLVSAQSLEWLAEHPGATTQSMGQATMPVSAPPINSNEGLEMKVRSAFADAPLMAEIARCESRFRQYGSSGNALDGGSGGMIGLFQINASVHAAYARSLGMDIYTPDGNIAYARKLYQEEGTDPWLSSFSCWHNASQTNNQPVTLSQDLILGTISPEVRALQSILNTKGYVLTTSGPGSPGQETDKFGSLTRVALRKFQCTVMQICSGSEHENEYGMVGVKTRAALLGETASAPQTSSSSDTEQIALLQKQIQELSAQLFALRQTIAMR